MQFEQLVLQSNGQAVALAFHPRLTVVAGVGPTERSSLVGELLGGLAGTRQGLVLRVVDDAGRRLRITRDATGRSIIEDVTERSNLSADFEDPSGRLDMLASGLGLARTTDLCRMNAVDLHAGGNQSAIIGRLTAVNQKSLWKAADRLRSADQLLKREAQEVDAEPEDAVVVEEIEERHEAFEAAQRRHEYVRHHALFTGGAAAIAAVPAGLLERLVALPFLAVALVSTLVSIRFRRRMTRAREAESAALAVAGAQSYLSFHVGRLNRLLSNQVDLHRLTEASAVHRAALEVWRSLAGDIPVEVALSVRSEVDKAASSPSALTAARAGDAEAQSKVEVASLAETLIARIMQLRSLSAAGGSFPLILDEPLAGLAPSMKHWLLELIGRSAGSPQIIYLTEDEDVAHWARIERVNDNLAMIEAVARPQDDIIVI